MEAGGGKGSPKTPAAAGMMGGSSIRLNSPDFNLQICLLLQSKQHLLPPLPKTPWRSHWPLYPSLTGDYLSSSPMYRMLLSTQRHAKIHCYISPTTSDSYLSAFLLEAKITLSLFKTYLLPLLFLTPFLPASQLPPFILFMQSFFWFKCIPHRVHLVLNKPSVLAFLYISSPFPCDRLVLL